MSFIYVASSYSHPDPAVREDRFQEVCRFCSRAMKAGHKVFSPIAHSHPIALAGGLPTDWEFWKEYDEAMIQACDEVWVLTMDGWDRAKGGKAEIEACASLILKQ